MKNKKIGENSLWKYHQLSCPVLNAKKYFVIKIRIWVLVKEFYLLVVCQVLDLLTWLWVLIANISFNNSIYFQSSWNFLSWCAFIWMSFKLNGLKFSFNYIVHFNKRTHLNSYRKLFLRNCGLIVFWPKIWKFKKNIGNAYDGDTHVGY